MCLLNRNIHSLYCGSDVHQVRRIFKAVPSCLNIASFSPLMYLPCKQQQFVQKYNQRWPKSPSVVATFAAVSEATESYSFMRHVSMFQHGQFTGPCLAKYGQDSAFFSAWKWAVVGKADKPMDFGASYLWETYRLRHNLSSYPIPQSESHIKLYWEEGNCVHQTIL